MERCVFPMQLEIVNRRIQANYNLLKELLDKPSIHAMYEPTVYACARRLTKFTRYLYQELRDV